jgi:hypothetical protein
MNNLAFLKLIEEGLQQPSVEPTFFSYPAGYEMNATSTCYSLSDILDPKLLRGNVNHAGLGPSIKRD